jgi:hypothetical protein
MSTAWRVVVITVGVLAVVAIGLSIYTLATMNSRVDDRITLSSLRGDVGPRGPVGPVGPVGAQGPQGPQGGIAGCAINPADWNRFVLDLGNALETTIAQGGTVIYSGRPPSLVCG